MSGMNHFIYSPKFPRDSCGFFFLKLRNYGSDAAHDAEQLDSAGNVDIKLYGLELSGHKGTIL